MRRGSTAIGRERSRANEHLWHRARFCCHCQRRQQAKEIFVDARKGVAQSRLLLPSGRCRKMKNQLRFGLGKAALKCFMVVQVQAVQLDIAPELTQAMQAGFRANQHMNDVVFFQAAGDKMRANETCAASYQHTSHLCASQTCGKSRVL